VLEEAATIIRGLSERRFTFTGRLDRSEAAELKPKRPDASPSG
jgi:hypothetical protein